MKLQTKLTLLIIFCASVFLGLALIDRNIEKERLYAIFRAEEEASNIAFDKALKLLQRSLETFVFDYTYWDEMVKFFQTGDKVWASMNIDTSLSTYKADAAWVYKKDRSLIYSANNVRSQELKELPISWTAISDLFEKTRFCHFFANTPKGLIEIRGATVHPSADPDRKTDPVGYFFAGRLWNEKYLADLALLTDTNVSVTPTTQVIDLKYASNPQRGLIASSRSLKDCDGNPIARLNILKESVSIKAFARAADRMMLIIILFSVLTFIALRISFTYWINIPLRQITKNILDKMPFQDKRDIDGDDEFSAMSVMMNKFFEQRERLTSEIVDHNKAESQLRLSEEKFSKAFRVNPNPMAIFMADTGRFLDANDVFLNLTGYNRSKVLNHTLKELGILTEDSRLSIEQTLKDHGRLHNIELDIKASSGEVRNWLFSASVIEIGKDSIVLAVSTDVTENRKAKKELDLAQGQLVQAEKLAALGRFASGLAHEIKNPLAVLLGGMEYLRKKLSDADPDVRESLEKMKESLMRANIVIKDLLSFSKPSKLVREKVHPNLLVHDAIGFVELFKHKSDTAEVELKQDLTDQYIYVEVDKNQMQQALFNILLNAIEAVSMKARIIIKTYVLGQSCIIEVCDKGEGIAKENLAKIFEPFFTTKRGSKGTGLGLPIVKTIIERHNGTITIDSELGKGTTVKIALPLVSA